MRACRARAGMARACKEQILAHKGRCQHQCCHCQLCCRLCLWKHVQCTEQSMRGWIVCGSPGVLPFSTGWQPQRYSTDWQPMHSATREMRPSPMVENSPNNHTVASGETCFDEATRAGKTVARTYPVSLAAPSARRPPVPLQSVPHWWSQCFRKGGMVGPG